MAMNIRIYGTTDALPSLDEIVDALEEAEFDVEVELHDEEENEEEWTEAMVYESSLDEPIDVFRIDGDALQEELAELAGILDEHGDCDESGFLINNIQSAVVGFGIEIPEDQSDKDNALLMAMLVAQFLAQKVDGIYTVDSEGFFDETGELIFALAEEE